MKFSDNYGFSLPNKADRDSADIDVISENFKEIDKLLAEFNSAKLMPENTIVFDTPVKEIPKGITKNAISINIEGKAKRGLLISLRVSGLFTEIRQIFIDSYGYIEERKSMSQSGGYIWSQWDSYLTKTEIQSLVNERNDYVLTEEDKQEIAQNATSVCVAKNQGASNVGKILAVGTDGNITLVDMPEGGASGDVTGVLDESNNILLSGNLADGTYTLKYENADGTYTDIGTLEVGAIPEPVEPVTENITLTDGIRVGSDGGDRAQAGCCATPHIDLTNIPKPCTIHLTGARWAFYDTAATGHIMYYAKKTDGSKLAGGYTNDSIGDGYFSLVRNGGGENETDVTVTVTSDEVASIRFGGVWTTVNPNTMQAKATLTYTPNA